MREGLEMIKADGDMVENRSDSRVNVLYYADYIMGVLDSIGWLVGL